MLEPGITLILAPDPPLLHEYVLAPLAESVELSPLQIDAGVALEVIVGKGFTVTLTEAVPVHPALDVPVTIYVVLDMGLTEMLEPLPPELQVYVLAPDPVSVVLCPVQMATGDADADTEGKGFTITVTEAVPVHPAVVVPVT